MGDETLLVPKAPAWERTLWKLRFPVPELVHTASRLIPLID